MPEIRNGDVSDIPSIREVAEKTWWATYKTILSKEQLQYMLDYIYSEDMLRKVMEDGSQQFIILTENGTFQGFASYGKRVDEETVYKLHKLYVLPENHGKGFGKLLIEEIKNRVTVAGAHALDLNVNRYNPAKSFYERLGFRVIREEDIPIGPYWMNDYVMRIEF